MTSIINGTRLVAVSAALGAALTGCDSIKDVRSDPYTELPSQTVVLEGNISGLGSRRSIVLMNNGDAERARSFLAPVPIEPGAEDAPTHFSFGAIPVGSPYNIEVRQQPIGKTCTVSNGSGTLTTAGDLDIQVSCQNSTPRYSMIVDAAAIAGVEGAKVTLATEEAVYELDVPAGTTTVNFADTLFNPAFGLSPAEAAVTPPFQWSVTASTTQGGTLNKCPVINPTNPGGANPVSPTGDITNVRAETCVFSIGGTVAYSLPQAGAPVPADPSGLVLELRTTGEDSISTQAFSGGWGDAFTFSDAGTPVPYVSNSSAVYYVTVATHPAGMHCVVVNPMAILYAPQLTQNPTHVTSPSVQCREQPAADRQLMGVYRHTQSIWQRNPSAPVVEVTWDPFDFTKQNTASSNMIAFFPNGTYIYGTHANVTQVEHGFYDYDPVAGTLRFTLNVDTTAAGPAATRFPANFSPANATSAATVPTTTNGLTSVPGTVMVGTVRHAILNNVDVSTPGVISGQFAGAQTLFAAPATTTNEPNATLGWVLEAPHSIANEITGGWLAQDSRRLWVYDRRTYYGYHVGVSGVLSVNDACFTIDDLSASSSFYTRRPSIIGCYPWPRPATDQSPGYAIGAIVESIDSITPQYIGAAGADRIDIGLLPEFMSRLPGGRQAADGRSPSPIYFHVAPADQFFAAAPVDYFPPEETGWCDTEILGIRSTLNGIAIHKPLYFCRFVPEAVAPPT